MKKRLTASLLVLIALFLVALPVSASSVDQWVELDYWSSSKDSYSRYGTDVYINVSNTAVGSNRSSIYFEVVDAWEGVIDSGVVIPSYDYYNNIQNGEYVTSREYHFDTAHPVHVVLYSMNGYGSEGDAYIMWENN
ncbi:hypothetical protein SK3146_00896 [Paenibacillus konkukensis]|uniref:Uncharacterized protein n=1 Tax=Paenibacillus konkukensis TaxID=2020716 RepID=A0ABY4RIA0_9BACL|nr:hypothetical protein [Paenibacillus konkukensis]UQZ81740.1 hypothetical protein SK3146_00896 [Paenibacillus konkukensis]